MKYLSFLSIFLLFVILISCKKNDPPVPYYSMDEDFKAYFTVGGVGSKWIYYDSIYNVYDTTTITKKELSGASVDEPVNISRKVKQEFDSENYEINYQSSRNGNYWTQLSTYPRKDSAGNVKLYSSYKNDLSSVSTATYSDKKFLEPHITHLDSFTAFGKTYYDVINVGEIMVARNIGVIYKKGLYLINYDLK